ncbi:NADH-quinone oxidoreductase subunit J [Corynebacterium uterequi]|uniref:NADH-quinone oxidoreductase subunit J n=1 Tax=Corynebacterium uterequi TaxID=1072256 RepID=A0A0G3HBJ9_9CORY|nr:NADH-quinone oxidoreductase subunit J [Corynebacterium uterequi]AKK10629.1 NADH:ubiquinone oxidoreductase subunit 6 (chain J) [Corynebacterium uterequi]
MAVIATVAAWALAAIIVALAAGLILCRELLHSALCMLGVMIGLAVFYAVLAAPFVFAVQIVVYAGAIMVMILFIVMMVGARGQAADGEPIKNQRVEAAILAAVIAAVLAGGIVLATKDHGQPEGLDAVVDAAGGNIQAVGMELFTKYFLAFEVLSALLIVAAVGAMVVIFRVRRPARPTQRELSKARFARWAQDGTNVGAKAGAGVYATSNSMDVPALLPDGTAFAGSVAEDLVARGETESPAVHRAPTEANYAALGRSAGATDADAKEKER